MASAPSAPNISLPIADHNAPLVGDVLSTVTLNYQWRRTLVHLAERLLDRRIYDGTEAEIDTAIQQVHALLSDMYTLEATDVHIGARVSLDANFSLSPIGWFAPAFPDPSIDPDNFDTSSFYNAANPQRLTVPGGMDGIYRMHAQVAFAAGTSTILRLRIFKSGVEEKANAQVTSGGRSDFDCTCMIPLIAGDFVELELRVNATRTVIAGGFDDLTFLDIQRVMDTP